MGIVPAGRGQDVVVVRGKGDLPADVDMNPIDDGSGGSVDQAVDERGVGVLEDLLDRHETGRAPARPILETAAAVVADSGDRLAGTELRAYLLGPALVKAAGSPSLLFLTMLSP